MMLCAWVHACNPCQLTKRAHSMRRLVQQTPQRCSQPPTGAGTGLAQPCRSMVRCLTSAAGEALVNAAWAAAHLSCICCRRELGRNQSPILFTGCERVVGMRL